MNSSPITAWDHASAYFTFFDKPGLVMAILLASVILTAWVIVATMRHEKRSEGELVGGAAPAQKSFGMAAEEMGAG